MPITLLTHNPRTVSFYGGMTGVSGSLTPVDLATGESLLLAEGEFTDVMIASPALPEETTEVALSCNALVTITNDRPLNHDLTTGSESMTETNADGDTVLTQYFERAVFEYHPNKSATYQVLLRRLGAEILESWGW